MRRECERCGIHLVPAMTAVLEVTHAYVRTRREGGANALVRAEYSGRAWCVPCFLEREQGKQMSLFGGDP